MTDREAVKRGMALEEVLARYEKGAVYELDMLVYLVVAARYYPLGRIWQGIPGQLRSRFKDFVLETPIDVEFLKGTFTHYWNHRLLGLWKGFFTSGKDSGGGSFSKEPSPYNVGELVQASSRR